MVGHAFILMQVTLHGEGNADKCCAEPNERPAIHTRRVIRTKDVERDDDRRRQSRYGCEPGCESTSAATPDGADDESEHQSCAVRPE